jgi:DNA-binding NarL/FixJ family response regulator
MLRALLETHPGWQVCGEAENGVEAVQKAAQLKPDLIILDILMPQMNGFQAAKQIHSTSPHMPILIFTGYAISLRDKLETRECGVRDIISKTTAPSRLMDAVETGLRETARSSSAAS